MFKPVSEVESLTVGPVGFRLKMTSLCIGLHLLKYNEMSFQLYCLYKEKRTADYLLAEEQKKSFVNLIAVEHFCIR